MTSKPKKRWAWKEVMVFAGGAVVTALSIIFGREMVAWKLVASFCIAAMVISGIHIRWPDAFDNRPFRRTATYAGAILIGAGAFAILHFTTIATRPPRAPNAPVSAPIHSPFSSSAPKKAAPETLANIELSNASASAASIRETNSVPAKAYPPGKAPAMNDGVVQYGPGSCASVHQSGGSVSCTTTVK